MYNQTRHESPHDGHKERPEQDEDDIVRPVGDYGEDKNRQDLKI